MNNLRFMSPIKTAGSAWDPSQKTGARVGFNIQRASTVSAGKITALADLSGNGRNASFASGKEADYTASYLNGKAAAKLLSTTVGTYGTDNLVVVGSAHSFFTVIQNTTESGTYYHCFFSIRSGTANENVNLVVSNDTNYGIFSNILATPNAAVVGNNTALSTVTNNACSYIQNYNGGGISTAGSYATWLNNVSLAMTSQVGTAGNNTNANQIGSYANTSPPAFPATNCYLLEMWVYDSVISSAERALFATYVASTYGI